MRACAYVLRVSILLSGCARVIIVLHSDSAEMNNIDPKGKLKMQNKEIQSISCIYLVPFLFGCLLSFFLLISYCNVDFNSCIYSEHANNSLFVHILIGAQLFFLSPYKAVEKIRNIPYFLFNQHFLDVLWSFHSSVC